MELCASVPGLAVEESYIRLLNHLPGLAYRCRVTENESSVAERIEYVLEFASRGSYDLLGIPAEEMVRNNYNTSERMTHPDDLQRMRRDIYDSIVAHQPYQVMYRVLLPSGRLKWLWDQGEGVFDGTGKLRYLEGLIMDISEQKFQELELKEENRQLKASVSNLYGLGNIVGKSEAMRQVYNLILKAAETDTNVIIYGETGSGKDLVAKAIHEFSARKGNYVPVNCGAIPEQLLESEFFGHTKGAFSGAHANKEGYIGAAHNGTLFLDEIGTMPLYLQVKLLRVLQERRFERVGGSEEIEVDIRIVAATNKDLMPLVQAGTFREDLYYRLNVVHIPIPPLRERREDIPLLVAHFAEKAAKENGIPPKTFSTEALNHLSGYEWPGNIRQLQNVVERCLVLVPGDVITLEDLPAEIRDEEAQFKSAVDLLPVQLDLADTLERIEAALIRRALVRADFVQAKAAELLGISKSLMQYKLKKYSITGH